MLKFHEENHNIFDFFIKVEKENDTYNVKALFPENQDIPDVLKNIGLFCFPYDQLIIDEEYQFYLCLTDSTKKQTFIYVNRKKTVAFCLVTPFFHPHFFLEISYILSGIYESSISRACSKYLESKIYHDKVDWRASWNLTPTKDFEISNFDQYCNEISPSCELSKLFQYIFCKLPIQYILITLVAMTLDCRIIVTSSELSEISKAIFSLIALIYPLKWPGTFIPILPSSILTMLDAPFAYLIGIHSSAADAMISIDRYFIVNVDFHYCASIGMEDFPPEVLKYIDERSDSLKKMINKYSPIFPFVQIQKQIRMFIRDLFGVAYNINKTDDYQQIVQSYNKWKSVPSEEFKAIFSQTQFINGFISEIVYEHNTEIFQAFWPNHVFIQASPPSADDEKDKKEIPKHCGLKRCRKNSIGKQDLEKILCTSNQSFFDISDDTENTSNEGKTDDSNEILKLEANNDENTKEIININKNDKKEGNKKEDDKNKGDTIKGDENEGDKNENIKTETDNIKDEPQHHSSSKHRKRKNVNSIQLATLDLKKLDLSNSNSNSYLNENDNELFEYSQQSNSSRRYKRKRSSKHRSQSVENKLLYKNNSYSIINNRCSNEEPPPSMKTGFPQFFDKTHESYIKNANDKDFIEADDDLNLSPTPRKMPPNLPVPKKNTIKMPDIPLPNKCACDTMELNNNSNLIPNNIDTNNGSQSSRTGIPKFHSFNYASMPKGGILVSSSRVSRNSSESNIHQEGIKRVGIAKRSSSTALNSSKDDEKSNEDHTRKRKKKRRTNSNLTDKERDFKFHQIEQNTNSIDSIQKALRNSNELIKKENNDSAENDKEIYKSNIQPILIENKNRNNQNTTSNEADNSNNEIQITSKHETNTNTDDDKLDTNIKSENGDETNKKPFKQPVSPSKKQCRFRPLPGSLDNRNKVSSLQLNKINNIRSYRQLTPRNGHTDRNSAQLSGIRTNGKFTIRNLSPTQRLSSNPVAARHIPKFKLEINVNSSEYEYNYSDNEDQNDKITKNNDKSDKAPVLSARIDSTNIQRNNILVHHFQRKRKTSLETPKPVPVKSTQTNTNKNASDNNNNESTSPRNNELLNRPRITPNIRRNIPSKIYPNQQKSPALLRFSSSSDYYEYN